MSYQAERIHADAHRAQAAEVARWTNAYERNAPRPKLVKVCVLTPFYVDGYATQVGDVVSVPDDTAQWLCHPSIGRAERV